MCEAYDVTSSWHHSSYNLPILIKSVRSLNHSKVSMCHTTFHFIDLFCLLYLQGFMHKTWQSFSYEWNENACHFKSDCSRKNLLKKSYLSMLQNFVLRPPCYFHQITLVQNFKVVLKDIFSTFFLLNISWSPKTMGMNWKKNWMEQKYPYRIWWIFWKVIEKNSNRFF